jgi:5'-phosphate synthase pdxT subunit
LALEVLGVKVTAVRLPSQLEELDGLVIPGGESTAISKLMVTYGFYEPIIELAAAGLSVWGTCAGAILIAKNVVDGIPGQRGLELMDIDVRRNAFGRQKESFEVGLDFADMDTPYTGVFIRAPRIERIGPDVEVLATHEKAIVAARQGRFMATSFHPELTGDPRVHRYFVEQVIGG